MRSGLGLAQPLRAAGPKGAKARQAVLGTAIAGINETGFGAHPTDSWSLVGYGLAAGDYAIRVDGQVRGAGGGAFGADLTVSPVPEPQAWGMLLAGIGVIGTLTRRKKKRSRV